MANNVQNVKFLRNGTLFESRSAAQAGMEAQLNSLADGTAILGRYSGTTTGDTPTTYYKTLVGFVFNDGTNKSLTIFDVESASADVEALRQEINAKLGGGISSENTATAQLTALSGTSSASSADTSVWGAKKYASAYTDSVIDGLEVTEITAPAGAFINAVSETDGKISASTAYMPTVSEIKETGKAIIAVSQTNGTIFATAGNIAAAHVSVDDSGSLLTATTVEGALAEIAAEIDAMDLAVVSGDGEVITAVSENDGKVSASKTAIKDVKLTGYVKNTAATGAISGNDDIEDALSKLENTIGSNAITNADGSITVTPANGSTTDVKVHIKSGENVIKLDANGGGIYTNLNLVEITGDTLPAEIKVRYELRNSDNIKIGESIDIPKDSHIVSISYDENAQKLVYTYIDVSGATKTTKIDLSHLVLEAEFASGVTFSDGVAHGVVDPTSEKDSSNDSFLTVGANGFKVDGIKDEIDAKINALDATVGSTTVESDKHVAVQVVEDSGKLTALTVTENDIASAQGLADEITARTAADTELSNRLGASVTTTNTATAQLTALSGTSADASGVTSVWGAKAYAKDYTDEKVAAVVAGLDATVSGESTDHKVNVKVTETNGVITAVNVVGSDIASANDLANEITHRKAIDGVNGNAYTANTGTNYISDASNLNDADVKLDAQAKVNADNILKNKVNAGNGISVAGGTSTTDGTTVSVKLDTTTYTGGNALVADSNGLRISTIDCGEY